MKRTTTMTRMRNGICLAAFGAALGVGAMPSVTDVALAVDPGTRRVRVDYALANGPAIVTMELLTNGVSIGEANFAEAYGDVNRKVDADGAHKIFWRPDRAWTGNVAELTARITAWEPENPPDYAVVDLESPSAPRFYTSTNAIPGGVGDALYKRRRYVMRRIPAKNVTWRMGAPEGELGQTTYEGVTTDTTAIEAPHLVTFTRDYYMGIYPVTRRHFISAFGVTASVAGSDDQCPAQGESYNSLRGSGWPTSGHDVGSGSRLAALRALTGVDFDLPTEAEWEYACRAGTGTALNSGKDLTHMKSSGPLDPLAWYCGTAGNQLHRVGLKEPNAWGLYDMHGNVWERCLDWVAGQDGVLSPLTGPVTDPVGAQTGRYRSARGGGYASDAYKCRSGYRPKSEPNDSGSSDIGFRLVCPVTMTWSAPEPAPEDEPQAN